MSPSASSDHQAAAAAAPPLLGASHRNDYEDDQSSTLSSDHDSDWEAEVAIRQRQLNQKQITRFVSLISATAIALCAGSLVVFSLYAPKFQSRLHYTQFQVNGVAMGGSLAVYLPIPFMGYVCDRVGVAPLAFLSSILFGGGYGLAAFIYRKLDIQYNTLGRPHEPGNEWLYPLMVFAFVCVGAGTCAMYISTVSTCAKNFGKGKYRGLALAMPITGFGLSGMWLSQAGSHFLATTKPDGTKGDVDVFRFFVFLSVLLFIMGIVGTFTLNIVDEQDLIDEAIEELEQSGMLDGSALLGRAERGGYGAINSGASIDDVEERSLLAQSLNDDAKWKKNWVLNAETRSFLNDHTMWPFAIAFFLMIGPGEAFINNLGTIIGTLSPPGAEGFGKASDPATHVSVFGITSTIARLLIGTLTDLLAPAPQTQHIQIANQHPASSHPKRFAISRVAFMLFFAGLLSLGLAFLASGAAQNHADRFWIVSGLVGAGYGATFSLTPLIVTIIWGVENFATNFGIIATLPAVGSTVWGLIYSAVYQTGAKVTRSVDSSNGDEDIFCYGKQCYAPTYWAEAITVWIACGLLLWAWKGKGGWQQRGIVI